MATPAEQLRAALESDDRQLLWKLCRQLQGNPVLAACGYEMSAAHHLAMKPYGYRSFKAMLKCLGPAACLSVVNGNGNTPVHLAAMFQDEAWMALIHRAVGAGCFEVSGKHNRTAVHFAAMNCSGNSALKWLTRLLGQRSIRAADDEGNLPLHLSAWRQGADSMRFFKEQLGPYCFQLPGRGGRTAVHQAATNQGSNKALKWLVGECGSGCLTARDDTGNAAVHLAAWKQGADSLGFILQQLGDEAFDLRGIHGYSAAHLAAMNTDGGSAFAWCARELVPSRLLTRDSHERTPVHLAAQHQDGAEAVQAAVGALGLACLTLPDRRLRTPVHCAAQNARSCAPLLWIATLLGPECLRVADAEGDAAVHLAAQCQGVDSLRFIKDKLGSPAFSLEGQRKRTMAHFAAQNSRNAEAMLHWIAQEIGSQCLLATDADGCTPGQLAAHSCSAIGIGNSSRQLASASSLCD